MATYGELIAHRCQEVDEIRRQVGADSLGYLSLEGAYRAVGLKPEGFCTACFSGDYPVPVQLGFERASAKLQLENPRALDVDKPSSSELPRSPAVTITP